MTSKKYQEMVERDLVIILLNVTKNSINFFNQNNVSILTNSVNDFLHPLVLSHLLMQQVTAVSY